MPAELALYITKYGYLAIFSLIFLQEIGVPNPVPNELVLLFAGYLASVHVLSLTLVLLTVILADFIGTSILYAFFYLFGDYVMDHKPKWLPISKEKIMKLSNKISQREQWGIYVGRLIPYLRGYTSVAAGLLKIRPRVFLTAVIVSAITWSGSYALVGKFMGKYWQQFAGQLGGYESILFLVIVLLVVIYGVRYVARYRQKKKEGQI
ncbi:DedA family protein [Patescibacteria group bacterium]|nr:DedA family protein [Patescibacteria group bacterium]